MAKETEKLIIRKKTPVVTRHKALVAYLLDRDIIKDGEYKLIEHADYSDIEGQDVIGVLPLQLCAYAKSITEIPLKLTPEMRGKELTFEEVEKVADKPVQYKVREVDSSDGYDYYLSILESYTDEEYQVAYRYYRHVEISNNYYRTYKDIAKARTIYMDILNALYGMFDIFTIENRGWRNFEFMRINNLRFRCSLVYEDATDEEIAPTTSVQLENFDKEHVLKFVDELSDMCL